LILFDFCVCRALTVLLWEESFEEFMHFRNDLDNFKGGGLKIKAGQAREENGGWSHYLLLKVPWESAQTSLDKEDIDFAKTGSSPCANTKNKRDGHSD
jgi:hypothetical protein